MGVRGEVAVSLDVNLLREAEQLCLLMEMGVVEGGSRQEFHPALLSQKVYTVDLVNEQVGPAQGVFPAVGQRAGVHAQLLDGPIYLLGKIGFVVCLSPEVAIQLQQSRVRDQVEAAELHFQSLQVPARRASQLSQLRQKGKQILIKNLRHNLLVLAGKGNDRQ